jgi:multiple sugar transport system permease protein
LRRNKFSLGPDAKIAAVLLAPNIIWVLIFTVFSIIYSVFLSFNNVNLFDNSFSFVGLQNYTASFMDPIFRQALLNTIVFTAVSVPCTMAIAIFLAVLLNGEIKGRSIMRSAYFLPSVLPVIAICQVWIWIYEPTYGILNFVLESLHITTSANPIHWLSSPNTSMISVIIFSVWETFGYDMVIYLAALQDVPKQLYEAADIDGANGIQKFFYISLPEVRPATFFIMIISISGAFQTFSQIYALTQGGPMDTTNLISYYIYQYAFQYFKIGRGAAVSVIMFLMLFAITIWRWKSYEKSED